MKMHFIFFLLIVLSVPAWAQDIYVVVPDNSPHKDQFIEKSELHQIFLIKKTHFADGTAIMPYRLSSDTDKAFLAKVFGPASRAYERMLKTQVFAGAGREPEKIESDDDIPNKLKSSKGSISYTSKKNLPGLRYLEIK